MSVLLTLILTVVIVRTAGSQVSSSIGANLAELAHQTASRLDRSMFERYREVELMARRLGGSSDMAQVRAELDQLQASYPYYAWIGAADNTGQVLAATKGMLVGANVSARPWFSNAYRGRFVGDVHEALLLAKLLRPQGGEPLRFVDLAFPLAAADGRTRGVLGAHLSWEWARDLEHTIFVPIDKESGVEPLIVGAEGAVLLGPDRELGRSIEVPSLASARAGQTGYRVERWPDGQDYLVGYSRSNGHGGYPGLGWIMLVRQPLSEAYEPVRDLQWQVFGSGLVIALVFSALGWFAAKVITRPVLDLADFASQMKSQPGARARPSTAYREVGQLGEALNGMLADLQRKEQDLRELNVSLEGQVEVRTHHLRQALEEVRRNEQRIHTIIESAQDPFVGVDFEGRLTDWNSQAEKLFGWRRDEVLGQPLASTIIPPRYRQATHNALRAFIGTGQAGFIDRPMERILVDRHGREIPVEVKLGLVDTGQSRFFCGFIHDISARKEVERLKSEFVATVSHELRTPLTSIYGALKIITAANVDLPAQIRQLVAISIASCERLVRLINDVLDVEKMASGQLAYEFRRQALAPLVEQAMGDVGGFAAQHGVHLALQASTDAAVDVEVDADRIVQVLVNLLSNAVKFSPAGASVRVVLSVHEDKVRVGVIDQGPGVPPAFRDRIFDRFAQADGSDRRAKGGTGLGLNICRSIVQAHRGHIDFSSEPGVRTEFFFDLPLASAAVRGADAARRSDVH